MDHFNLETCVFQFGEVFLYRLMISFFLCFLDFSSKAFIFCLLICLSGKFTKFFLPTFLLIFKDFCSHVFDFQFLVFYFLSVVSFSYFMGAIPSLFSLKMLGVVLLKCFILFLTLFLFPLGSFSQFALVSFLCGRGIPQTSVHLY